MVGEQDIDMKLSTAFSLRGSFSQMLSLVYSLKKPHDIAFIPLVLIACNDGLQGRSHPIGLQAWNYRFFAGLITLPLVINYGLLGSAKKLRAQSIAEVSAY